MPQKRLTYDPYRDYYLILTIDPKATPEEIQRAYRERAKVLHPDRNKDPNATAQFQTLNEAYETLRDRDSRYVYDSLRARATGIPFMSTFEKAGTVGSQRGKMRWGAVMTGMLNSPSHRLLLLIVGVVIVVNMTFIIFMYANRPSAATIPPEVIDRPLPDHAGDGERCPTGALILSPREGSQISGGFEVTGTTGAAYALDWTPANITENGSIQEFVWSPLTSGDSAVTRGRLASAEETAALPTGRIRLRLTAGGQICEVTILH
jgi:hypothetical protein